MDLYESFERLDLGQEICFPKLNFPSSEDFRMVITDMYSQDDPFETGNGDNEMWCNGDAFDWTDDIGSGSARISKNAIRNKAVGRWNQARRATVMPDSFGSIVSAATQTNRRKSRATSAQLPDTPNSQSKARRWSLAKHSTSNVDEFGSTATANVAGPVQRRVSTTKAREEQKRRLKLRETAERGWRRIRRYVEDLTFKRQTSRANTSWAMLRHHLYNMSDKDRTKRDLYERYGVIPRLTTDGTSCTNNVMLSARARELLSLQEKSKLYSHIVMRTRGASSHRQ